MTYQIRYFVANFVSLSASFNICSDLEKQYPGASRNDQQNTQLCPRQCRRQFYGKLPTQLCCDNQRTICVAKNGGYTPRIKHIDIRHRYICEACRNIITFNYVSSEEHVRWTDETSSTCQAGAEST
ncbi:uncharacterized protein LOC129767829 [Toxorhynchites rutilus septentrionalis]|uniref:uncharacterized protein LOC129767829 n=1 Tax=Toxorhynchites rutilus septentrionalis TaxID=329112 RepID=UPI002478E6EB|nr:uncharacterized protein LOC129767829 [Toxorhynchites rutilus septentrionalis]